MQVTGKLQAPKLYCTVCYRASGNVTYLIPLSRPNKVGLKCPFICPSTKSFFDFNEIWYVGSGR